MKFPTFKSVTLAVTICFAFYSIVGCSSAERTTKYLDKYDSMPYKDAITVHASKDVAYKAAIVSLQNRGYILTLSDPQTGIANLELNSPTKLPEEEKQSEVDNSLSAGTVVLIVLACVLVVGLIVLIANASSDDDSKDKKTESSKNTAARNGGDKRTQTGNANTNTGNQNTGRNNFSGGHHERHNWNPYVYPFVDLAVANPSPEPSYLYVVTLNTTSLNESTTEVKLSTVRLDLEDGEIMNSTRFENKYLNYSIFDGIGKEVQH